MVTILYAVSPIGLGHASRALVVGSILSKSGLDVRFAAGSRSVPFIRSRGFDVFDVVRAPAPMETDGRVVLSSLWYLRYLSGYRSSLSKMTNVIDEVNPELVVGDEEFSSLSIALDRGIKNVMVSDELELGFAKGLLARKIESRASRWYSNLQGRVQHVLVPDFGDDGGNVHYVGPIVREVTKTREQVFAERGFPPDQRMILCSISGTGIGSFLIERAVGAFKKLRLPNTFLAIAGDERGTYSGEGVHDLGFVEDNQNLVACADLVISMAGKSTIDEAASCGTPMVAIPLKNHFEQEKNAESLGFSYPDVERLDELIPIHLGHRTEPKMYRGAETAASFITRLVS